MDCTSKLIRKLRQKKLSCARTKAESIVVNVLAPFALEELLSDLKNVNFISVMFDASNHGNIKVIPLLLRYFKPDGRIYVKLLQVKDFHVETSDIVTNYILDSLDQHDLRQKVVGLSADNTNTNFGGASRKGKCNVFTKLQSELPRELLGIGCSAHILNNCIKSACDRLPIDIESVLIKVYGYSKIHTVRAANLKHFCEESQVEYKKILGYCCTRWLSLMPAVERVLQMYEPLKAYF